MNAPPATVTAPARRGCSSIDGNTLESDSVTSAPVVLHVSADQARELHRSISLLVTDARRRLARRNTADPHLIVDLSAVPPIPACAPLLLLLRLLRRAGPAATITVTGPNSALAPCLVAGLPPGVVLVDRSGRRWPG